MPGFSNAPGAEAPFPFCLGKAKAEALAYLNEDKGLSPWGQTPCIYL